MTIKGLVKKLTQKEFDRDRVEVVVIDKYGNHYELNDPYLDGDRLIFSLGSVLQRWGYPGVNEENK